MNNQILFCGDPHGQLRHIVDAALRLRPMAVVLLGDMESPGPLHVELAPIRGAVWWVLGNHDSDRATSLSHLVDSEFADRQLDGRVVTLPDGTRLAGLGGVFRESIWYPPEPPRFDTYEGWSSALQRGRPGRETVSEPVRESIRATQRLTHRSSIFYADYLSLAQQPADILVTHEAGSSHPHGFDAIDELASAMGVHTTFHGHHHEGRSSDSALPSLGFRAFGVGLRGITGRDGEVVRAGERDHQRAGRGQA